MNYDATLVTSFAGPERPDHVMPFLENVLCGKNVPRERMVEVAEHTAAGGARSTTKTGNSSQLLRRNCLSTGLACPSMWGTVIGIPCSPTHCAR